MVGLSLTLPLQYMTDCYARGNKTSYCCPSCALWTSATA